MSLNDEKYSLGVIEWSAIIASGILIVFSFFAPKIFTMPSLSGLDFTETGEIGDTLGGIMNPFIAIAGVTLTFLAFYIQYKANVQQRTLFRHEMDFNKFENQFYEMLRLHKDNVNEISLDLAFDSTIGGQLNTNIEQIRGREAFGYFLEELKIIYYVIKKNFEINSKEDRVKMAYEIFFNGVSYYKKMPINTEERRKFREDVLKNLDYINNGNRSVGQRGNVYRFREFVYEKSDYASAESLSYNLFQGHSDKLAHYFRHLFQTVKFITKQDEKFIPYEDKRNYLRILRSQLSNQEQGMLFYNWMSSYGRKWENEQNKFFTDYRMIHNLYNKILISDFKLEDYFEESANLKKEKDRDEDDLFASQDWTIESNIFN
ncbi:putative phage abortive infection protein [Allomuricauda sp. NBRC 101325]|uniref:putative phage abortive infection protein n=1 Tax=Allomuricauda sp. NBRC 101325 TaxID=1113758 RepID=UPI0024A25A47|nr:putative phage abortive infection protein [Muricauda sp. NBRC 101325]GLU43877.1 hypothetical protein Musp01_15010 [Muricauda sp. NBRC 101325]